MEVLLDHDMLSITADVSFDLQFVAAGGLIAVVTGIEVHDPTIQHNAAVRDGKNEVVELFRYNS